MKAKEAIKRIENLQKSVLAATGELSLSPELELAIEALEKRVPKASVQKEDSAYGWAWYCPNCGCFIDPSTYKFCPECGQAIKKG